MKVVAQTRTETGSGASRRLRRAAQVPGILYGGSSAPTRIALDHNPLYHSLRVEAFHASILDMELDGKTEKVVLRDVQWHPYRPQVLHIDFQRIAADRRITMSVPLHFRNQEVSPAVKEQKAIVNHVLTEIEINCLPANLPEFIEVDLSRLTVDASIHLSALTLPDGVTINLPPGSDPVVASASVVAAAAADADEEAAKTAAAAAPAPAAAGKAAAAPAAGKAGGAASAAKK